MAERRRLQRRSTGSSSSRRSNPLRLSNPNIFSDDFALERLSVTGSSSPSSSTHDNSESTHTTPASNSQDHLNASSSDKSLQLQPSDSISQNSGLDDHASRQSIISQDDSPFSDPVPQRNASVRSASTASHGPQRSLSTASSFVPARVASPYRGPTGPSHPYAMYPQGVTRSSTISSNSTVRRPERAYVGGGGPEHPYSMYPQNTVPEMEEDPAMGFTHIPVGFPGHTQHYHRRIGPEGEELADIIGPDGHTEQLPPYTRYPDGYAPKEGLPEPASILSEERGMDHPITPVETRQERVTSRTAVVSNAPSSDHTSNDASGSFKEKLTEKGKKRVCRGCMPLWTLLLFLFLLLIGVVIGGVIGGVTALKKDKDSEAEAALDNSPSPAVSTVTATTTFVDATPLQTPFGQPDLPTGTYDIPINTVVDSSNSCLDNTDGFAWACESSVSLTVTLEDTAGGGNLATFHNPEWYNGSVIYGPQPPILDPTGYPLSMMLDKDSLFLGPALFFWDYYDKIVIVPEESFDPSNSKRDFSEDDIFERGMQREDIAQPGAKPWICIWNQTVIEFFIYVTQNTSEAQEAAASTSAAESLMTSYPSSSTPPTSSSSSIHSITGYGGGASTAAAAMSTSEPYMYGYDKSHEYDRGQPPYPHHRRGIDRINPTYPRIIKVEEKRKSQNNNAPYCQQYQVLNDGSAGPITLDNGDPIIVLLTETEPDPTAKRRRNGFRRWAVDFDKRNNNLESNCCCEWISN